MSDAAITAVVSGAAGVLGALVGGMSSYFVQKSTSLEKQVEERATAFVGFLTAAREVIGLLASGDREGQDDVWRQFESHYRLDYYVAQRKRQPEFVHLSR
jgi:hypothetical protein